VRTDGSCETGPIDSVSGSCRPRWIIGEVSSVYRRVGVEIDVWAVMREVLPDIFGETY